ncbi:MAG: cation:proton antiporter, partial [Pseudomonadales bacterium]|nr:cation:proton antiporter [Pseudomonadales bacterium]
MEEASRTLTLLGSIFLVSLIVSPISSRLNIPRVTLLILSGIALGPYGANFINGIEQSLFPIIADITLLIIGYLLGARMTKSYLQRYASGVFISSLVITLVTCLIVSGGLLLLGFSIEVSLVLGALACATDPAATLDVLKQHDKHSHFGSILEGIVAMDDILGLLVFSLLLAVVGLINGGDYFSHIGHLFWDIGGAVCLGIAMGGLTAFLLDKKPKEHPVLVESLGFIFLCGGIAMT